MNSTNQKSISNTKSTIICPSCGHDFDVEEAMHHQAKEDLRKEYNQKFLTLKKKMELEKESLVRERLEVKRLSAQSWEIIQSEIKKEKLRLQEKLKSEWETEVKQDQKVLEEALEKQRTENLILKRRELDILQKEKNLKLERQELEVQLEKAFIKKQMEEEETLRKQFRSKEDLMKIEYEKRLNDQKKLIEEMTRKMEQGSVQLQGEAQELAIETYLKELFPFDKIEPVKTGTRGADCIQHVRSGASEICGLIYYESKRTKHWQHTWLEKFRSDMRLHKADIGILVTKSLPKDMTQMGQKEGVWVCTFEEFKGLVQVIRENIIRVHDILRAQKQSGSKMNMLYNYLISNEFRMQIEGIVEGFIQLQDELNKEKRAMHAIWKRREKQIEKVLLNTNHFYNSMKGIAGAEIQNIDALELPANPK